MCMFECLKCGKIRDVAMAWAGNYYCSCGGIMHKIAKRPRVPCKDCRYSSKVEKDYGRHYTHQCGLDGGVHNQYFACKRGERPSQSNP